MAAILDFACFKFRIYKTFFSDNSLFEEHLCQISPFNVNFQIVFSYKAHYYMCLYVLWIEMYA